jgi:hypothetical protein
MNTPTDTKEKTVEEMAEAFCVSEHNKKPNAIAVKSLSEFVPWALKSNGLEDKRIGFLAGFKAAESALKAKHEKEMREAHNFGWHMSMEGCIDPDAPRNPDESWGLFLSQSQAKDKKGDV